MGNHRRGDAIRAFTVEPGDVTQIIVDERPLRLPVRRIQDLW